MKPPIIDFEQATGYLDNLIEALKVYSPDLLRSAIDYVHLAGLYFPLLPALKAYNDRVIDTGSTSELNQRESLLNDLINYVQYRKALLTGSSKPASLLEKYRYDRQIDSEKRLQVEYILGVIETLKITYKYPIQELKSSTLTTLPELQQQLTGVFEEGVNTHLAEIRDSIETDTFSEAMLAKLIKSVEEKLG